MTNSQKRNIMEKFDIPSEFELGRLILNPEKKNDVIRYAAKLMGVEVFGMRGKRINSKASRKSQIKAEAFRKWKNKYKK